MVRRATLKDIEDINKLGKYITNDFANLFKMEKIFKEDFAKVFVYEEKGKIVGFIHVTELYEVVDIVNIVIHPKRRNKGFASVLIDYIISDAGSLVQMVMLEVATDNEAAMGLYEKFGFEKVITRSTYYPGKDAYLMRKMVGVYE